MKLCHEDRFATVENTGLRAGAILAKCFDVGLVTLRQACYIIFVGSLETSQPFLCVVSLLRGDPALAPVFKTLFANAI